MVPKLQLICQQTEELIVVLSEAGWGVLGKYGLIAWTKWTTQITFLMSPNPSFLKFAPSLTFGHMRTFWRIHFLSIVTWLSPYHHTRVFTNVALWVKAKDRTSHFVSTGDPDPESAVGPESFVLSSRNMFVETRCGICGEIKSSKLYIFFISTVISSDRKKSHLGSRPRNRRQNGQQYLKKNFSPPSMRATLLISTLHHFGWVCSILFEVQLVSWGRNGICPEMVLELLEFWLIQPHTKSPPAASWQLTHIYQIPYQTTLITDIQGNTRTMDGPWLHWANGGKWRDFLE